MNKSRLDLVKYLIFKNKILMGKTLNRLQQRLS